MKRNAVIGQTGSVLLSDASVQRTMSRARTVRYCIVKLAGKKRYMAWVIGPFHSRTYGVVGFGSSKKVAKVALRRRLASDYRYFGNMMLSDHDEADSVGKVEHRLLDYGALTKEEVRPFGGYREYAKANGPII